MRQEPGHRRRRLAAFAASGAARTMTTRARTPTRSIASTPKTCSARSKAPTSARRATARSSWRPRRRCSSAHGRYAFVEQEAIYEITPDAAARDRVRRRMPSASRSGGYPTSPTIPASIFSGVSNEWRYVLAAARPARGACRRRSRSRRKGRGLFEGGARGQDVRRCRCCSSSKRSPSRAGSTPTSTWLSPRRFRA